MMPVSKRHGVAQYTLEHYEQDFADRHLLHGVIAKWARETPDKIALVEHDTGRECSYAQFHQLTGALALKLLELGFRKGDFLATSLPLLAEHIFLEYACFRIGVIHAPLDLRLKAPEVARSLDLIKPRGFVFLGKTPVADFSQLGRAIQEACPYIEHFIQFVPSGKQIEGAISALQLGADALELARQVTANPSHSPLWQLYQEVNGSIQETDGAQVIYTTGSTGMPKPALLSHRNITCQNMCLAGGFDMTDNPRMLVNLPPSHVGCQAEQLMTTLFSGGTAVILHMFDAEKSLRAIEKHRVDCFGQIPAMFAMQWRLPNYREFDLSSLRFALFGGQQVTRQFLEQLQQMAPRCGGGLGLTEMAGFVTYTPLDGSIDDLLAGVGYDMPVTPLSIRAPMNPDGSAGPELPDGEVGEICFTGPQVFISYVNDDEAYRRTVSTDGVCYTGDLGAKTERGLIFSGRSKLVIKPKGYQVHPAQVENHFAMLTSHVSACGAVGVPHEIYSEAIVLFVEMKPGASLSQDLLDQHAKEIAGYMRPSHYVMLGPGELPLNRSAKTDYVGLKERALAEVEQLRAAGQWDK
ncbi:MAG: acyl--CoA ligase [Pirellulales bacterium]|nr:acyl--CoA ligase [Pirellulales bacterium]